MRLSERLSVPRGIIAAVGGGGKTSLLWRLALELSENGRVVLTTTTHIRPPQCKTLLNPTRQAIAAALENHRLVAIGEPTPDGKLAEVKSLQGDYTWIADYVLIEADGSRGLPLKAPAEHEPRLPESASLVFIVAGMSCFGQTIEQAAHRPERYAALVGAEPSEPVKPEWVASVLDHPNGQHKNIHSRVCAVLNQADTPERLAFARDVAQRLQEDTVIVALQTRPDWAEYHACANRATGIS